MRIITIALAASLSLAAPVGATEPEPFPEFTFKRVGIPKPGARRITVQIEPTPIRPPTAAGAAAPGGSVIGGPNGGVATPEPSGPRVAAQLPYEGFWGTVSPALAAAQPGRLDKALVALDAAGVPTPRLDGVQAIAATHGVSILKASVGTRVSPALALAVISVESAGRTDAISTAGAQGLMQLMPATAKRFGVSDATDASENIRGGVAYLDWLLERFDGDPLLALAGYNAGETAVQRHGGVPPYAETRAYIPKVLAAWTVSRGLCRTPPELISDGCVFVTGG